MSRDGRSTVLILAAETVTAARDGRLEEARLFKDKRSPKVGALPEKARMVLAAASRCLPPSPSASFVPLSETGVSLGTLHGSMDAAELSLRTVEREGFGQVTPSWYATGLANTTAAILASVYGLGAPNLTFLGHQAGIDAIIAACRQIVLGRAVAMLAGGFDLPTAFYAAELAASRGPSFTATVLGGAGLLRLAADSVAEPALGRLIGWSQRFHEGSVPSLALLDAVVEEAVARSGRSATPSVHVVYPGSAGSDDHLAASAPIYLIEEIIRKGAPGLHAIVAQGFGPEVSALLVERA